MRAGTPAEAAAFGEVMLIAVPYGALPQVGRDFGAAMRGKVVLETGNPFPQRDGEMAEPARARGTGLASAAFLPGARLVRAFTSVAVGGLADAKRFDVGSAVFGKAMTARELRAALGIAQP